MVKLKNATIAHPMKIPTFERLIVCNCNMQIRSPFTFAYKITENGSVLTKGKFIHCVTKHFRIAYHDNPIRISFVHIR